MIHFVLDTNSVSDLFANREPILSRVVAAGDEVATTVITVQEVLSGWYTFLSQAKTPDQIILAYERLGRATAQLGRLPILPYSRTAFDHAATLIRQHRNVRAPDLRIAAIALEAGATVVTANVRDFGRVPGLAVEDWTQPPAPPPPVTGPAP